MDVATEWYPRPAPGPEQVNRDVAWASGSGGTCLRIIDGGQTWVISAVPGADDLDFRDVHAVNAETAYVLSIDEGENSHIFTTTDGGTTWALQHTNRDPKGFLDAVAFWDPEHGIVLGDPVDGRFMIRSGMGDGRGREDRQVHRSGEVITPGCL